MKPWEDTLDKYRRIPSSAIRGKLMVNPDLLEDMKDHFYKNYKSLSDVPMETLNDWKKLFNTTKSIKAKMIYELKLEMKIHRTKYKRPMTEKEKLEHVILMFMEYAHDQHSLDNYPEVLDTWDSGYTSPGKILFR
jgi:hypothetical protein